LELVLALESLPQLQQKVLRVNLKRQIRLQVL
jgi:hypothetical protein